MIIDTFMCSEYTLAMAKKAVEQNIMVTSTKIYHLDYDNPVLVVSFRASRGFEATAFKESIKNYQEYIK
ncbi:hypothetical protein NCTGTJJY_CDS0225 [Serratia phage 92A1]|nr:hypothetical protein NCTGTJJY_CDS0225 [Serratia phage 92A1]